MLARGTPGQRVVRGVSRTLGALRSGSRPGLRVLLYHAVGAIPDDNYGMSVTPGDFADQMRWLREESGCRVVSLQAGLAAIADAPGTQVAITFDDGFLNVLTEAAPILARHGIPFTVFVVGGYLTPRRHQYLDPEALRDLASVPHVSIGAHGFTHRPLSRLTRASLDEELRRSRDVLCASLGTEPRAISYPHGAVNRHVVAGAEAAGFTIGATSFVGVNGPGVHPLWLRRTEILTADGLPELSAKLRGDYDWYRFRQQVYWPLPPG